jgi:nitrogen fixation protein NifU and related proteins
MSSDLDNLYQEIILEHNRKPRNFGELPDANRTIEGRNPLCGDELKLALRVEGDRIEDVKYVAKGCAVSKASASLMSQAVKGKSREEADRLFERVHDMLTGRIADEEKKSLGSLVALSGVHKFPIRVKCASLPWHALRQAMEADDDPSPEAVSTE